MGKRFFTLILASAAVLAYAPSAVAAPPANDDRASATPLSVPLSLTGTTVDATAESGEPGSNCAGAGAGTVWYSVSGVNRRVAITVVADGDLDASIDVFERKRSQTQSVDCALTDKNGIGIVAFNAKSSSDYLIRVARRANSVDGTFSLEVAAAADDAGPPGRALPGNGVSDSVNLARNPSDTWAVRMKAGVSYRLNLAASSEDYCVRAVVYAHGEFGDDELVRLDCDDGYALFTPQAHKSGVFTILVTSAAHVLGNQRYHLEVARAQGDDTSPGVFWPGTRATGHLSGGGIDVVDIYNFDIRRRSNVSLTVNSRSAFGIELRTLSGRTLSSGDSESPIERRLSAGQYYAIVVAQGGESGSYKLRRVERAITHTAISFNRGKNASAGPGQTVRVTARVTPAVGGRVEITLQRLDPIFGWQFERLFAGSTGNGVFSATFTPPGVGRWRASAQYKGTRSANSSRSGWAKLSVGR